MPPSSRQTILPSSTADRVLISAAITSFRTEKDLNSFPLREMSLQLSVLDLSQRAKAVPFGLKKPIGMAEGSASATERHSLEMREGHSLYYKGSKSSKRNSTQGKALGIRFNRSKWIRARFPHSATISIRPRRIRDMFPPIPPEVLLAIWLSLAGCVMALCLYDEDDESGTP